MARDTSPTLSGRLTLGTSYAFFLSTAANTPPLIHTFTVRELLDITFQFESGGTTDDVTWQVLAGPKIESGTAQSGGASSITLASAESASDDQYNDCFIVITGGPGVGQVRKITDYVGSTKVATVDSAWGTQPDNTSTYDIYAFREVDAGELDVSALSDLVDGTALIGVAEFAAFRAKKSGSTDTITGSVWVQGDGVAA